MNMHEIELADGAEEDADDEDLQWDFEEVSGEVADLRTELHATEIEAKQLRMRLQTCAKSGGSASQHVHPAAMPSATGAAEEDRRVAELKSMLEWLAQHVDLHTVDVLDVGFEVPIGGRVVHLRRVAQWPLPSASGGRLRLTVPIEHQESIGQLLAVVQAAGGKIDASVARRFAAVWDFVPGELATAVPAGTAVGKTCSGPEPSVLLAHRGSTQGVLVASWPTREALEAFHAANVAALATFHLGERVEVEYEGKWYSGLLHDLDAEGQASVKCDADPDGVLTMTPLYRVRRASSVQPDDLAAPAAASVAGAPGMAASAGSPAIEQRELLREASPAARSMTIGGRGESFGSPSARPRTGACHRRTKSWDL